MGKTKHVAHGSSAASYSQLDCWIKRVKICASITVFIYVFIQYRYMFCKCICSYAECKDACRVLVPPGLDQAIGHGPDSIPYAMRINEQ